MEAILRKGVSLRAKKWFGQNFLKDSTILSKIIQSMSHCVSNTSNALVEIGPGLGDLTNELLHVKDVIAYEVDDDLSVLLKKRFNNEIQNGHFKLREMDVLEAWRENNSLHSSSYDIVANLPYYIATPIILRGLKDENCKSMTVMIQKEVAQKFSATPKMRDFSPLSILANTVAKVELLFDVQPSSFWPMPKVVSSVIRFEKIKEYKDVFGTNENFKKFEEYLRHAFKSPRKTLMKNLSFFAPKKELEEVFSEFNLPYTFRPHEVDTKTHHHLLKMITKVIKNEQKTPTG